MCMRIPSIHLSYAVDMGVLPPSLRALQRDLAVHKLLSNWQPKMAAQFQSDEGPKPILSECKDARMTDTC